MGSGCACIAHAIVRFGIFVLETVFCVLYVAYGPVLGMFVDGTGALS